MKTASRKIVHHGVDFTALQVINDFMDFYEVLVVMVLENRHHLDIDYLIVCFGGTSEGLSLERFDNEVILGLLTLAEEDLTVGANAKEFDEPVLIDLVLLGALT